MLGMNLIIPLRVCCTHEQELYRHSLNLAQFDICPCSERILDFVERNTPCFPKAQRQKQSPPPSAPPPNAEGASHQIGWRIFLMRRIYSSRFVSLILVRRTHGQALHRYNFNPAQFDIRPCSECILNFGDHKRVRRTLW